MNSVDEVWIQTRETIRFNVSRPAFETWFKDAICVSPTTDLYVIGVPTRLAQDWIEERFRSLIERAFREVNGSSRRVVIKVRKETP